MLHDQILTEALKKAIQRESGQAARFPLLTSRQRAKAEALAEKVVKNPPAAVPLTRREGDGTMKYFVLGKDALSDSPDWELY
jgi:hypothetical protein